MVFLIIFFLFFSTFQLLPTEVDSVFLDKFSNGEKEAYITFDRAGIDATSLAIDVPLNASILSASVDVTPIKHKNKYPTNIIVNVGNDEDNEWTFKGKGYGAFGKQTLYNDGEKAHLCQLRAVPARMMRSILLV
jgi:hypothetical protein